jgi:uncharacterized membrane protein (DUF485 family)
MAGPDHGTPPPPQQESEPASARQTRYGQILFVLYLVLYSGFVLLNAFAPSAMERTPFAGVNLAILYGLALIAFAFVLAVFYDWLCRLLGARRSRDTEGGK